jgi:shikimate kinase
MDYMLKQGSTIYLKATNETLIRRLKEARSKRPLVARKNDEELAVFVENEIKRRELGYLRSEYIYEADYLESIEQIADAVKEVKRVLKIE